MTWKQHAGSLRYSWWQWRLKWGRNVGATANKVKPQNSDRPFTWAVLHCQLKAAVKHYKRASCKKAACHIAGTSCQYPTHCPS
jgi:hypothetical protein